MATPLFVAGDRITVTPTSVVIHIVRVDLYPATEQGMGALLFIPNNLPTPPTIAAAIDRGLGAFFARNEEAAFAQARSLVEERRGQAGAPMADPAPWVYLMIQIPPHLLVQGSS